MGLSLAVLETKSAITATLNNVGPGFRAVGPMNSHLHVSAPMPVVMVGLIRRSRLELIPLLILLTRSYWRS